MLIGRCFAAVGSRRTVVLVAALLAGAVTARLGFWQLDRAQQKLALQARIESRAELPPLAQSDLARTLAAAPDQHFRRITLRGRWLAERTVYLDNRQMAARQGFYVVTPLLLAGGDAVLVQRGWAPRDFTDRNRLAPLATPAGEVLVTGRIAPPPSKLFELGGTESGPIRQNLEMSVFAREIGLVLRPVSVQQTRDTVLIVPGEPSANAGVHAEAPTDATDEAKSDTAEASLTASAATMSSGISAAAATTPSTAALSPSPTITTPESATPASASAVANAGPTDPLLRQWPAPAVDVGKHYGYAFQWFALCALITGLAMWFQILRPRLNRIHGRPT